MRRSTLLLALACSAALLLGAAPARADFGLSDVDVSFTGPGGANEAQAGAHPHEMTTYLRFNSTPTGEGGEYPDAPSRDIVLGQVPGFVGNLTAVSPCASLDFLTEIVNPVFGPKVPNCPDSAAVGYVAVELAVADAFGEVYSPVYFLTPPPGVAAKLGFRVLGVPVTIELGLSESPPYNVVGGPTNISQAVEVLGAELTLWGVPADPRHDPLRGHCFNTATGGSLGIECSANSAEVPFLTLPRSCKGPLETFWEAESWQGSTAKGSVPTHDESGNPQGMIGCGALGLAAGIDSKPTSKAAQSPTGLDFDLEIDDEGLVNPADGATAGADIAKTVVTLPPGMSVNPSQADGLEACSEAQLARERSDSPAGAGCPGASKIGTIEVDSQLLDQTLAGSLYIARPYANPTGELIALYVVIKDKELGVKVVQPLAVEADPRTGRLITTAENMPELPFSSFRLHFREGGRSPLITPPGCDGDPSRPGNQPHQVEAVLYPSSGTPPVQTSSSFEIVSGPNGSPCPTGAAPFDPGFEAGTLNNAAGEHSPFYMRLSRGDGMQDLTKFAATLPPGVVGKIGGIPYCPEAGIARARSRTGQGGGTAELGDPSCPAASQIGRTVGGAGVGSQLTYVPGSLYLAGPYNGAPLSVVSITPAVAGPFDAGTVVVRVALDLDPVTAEVSADGSASDPIPHILQGIPLNVRDLRVYVDRPEFTLNATSCEESQTRATLFGGGTVLAPTADTPVARSARYQAAGCASLGFKPRLGIKLRGGTRRGGHPGLRAVVTPRPGDANFSRAVVKLPTSAFLDQAHIRTICTRVQFAAGQGHGSQCPKGAQYGYARAWSPLLAEPLQGPVFLRSSNNNLPDLVVALKGLVDIELSARIDSVKGGIRSTFAAIPDAPVSRFILNMQGGKKGLIVNSRNLCRKAKRNRARSNIRGQNGRFSRTKPVVRAVACAKKRKAKRSSHRRARVASASAVR